MEQYLQLLKTIKEKGTYKPAAREGMPGTQSLFGYQFRHDLSNGFPLLTTKKIFWKGVVTELLWFLRGDTNIKYLVDNGVNIWNEDAFLYNQKKAKYPMPTLEEFVNLVRKEDLRGRVDDNDYEYGDCGYQYGKVWRNWSNPQYWYNGSRPMPFDDGVDQIKNVINSLRKNPESRRHIVTAIDPAHDQDLALYWCHAMFQFNCRPIVKGEHNKDGQYIPTDFPYDYYLDCQLYQRSADVVLGVPFNIASYALLIHIIAKICNMVPGEFIHTFGDVHIYDNHKEAVEEQLQRTPTQLPVLKIKDEGNDWAAISNLDFNLIEMLDSTDFIIENYNPQPAIKAKLSTGLN